MKKIIIFSILSIIQSNLIFAQNKDFSGRILYKNTFFSLAGVNITSKVTPMLGVEQDYYIKGNNYKSVLNGSAMTMQLYKGATNKYYMVMPDKTAQVMDASTDTDSVISVVHTIMDTSILNRKCKKVVITGSESITTYYYDPSLKVNKEAFKKHEFGNWNRYLQETDGALPIKYLVKMESFTWDSEATKIETMPLTDKDFELGSDIIVKN